MPCDSSYLQQTGREAERQRAAKLLVYAMGKMGVEPDEDLVQASRDYYCHDDYVPALCAFLHKLSPEDLERIVYDARSRESRDLADWWEEHQEADAARESESIWEE